MVQLSLEQTVWVRLGVADGALVRGGKNAVHGQLSDKKSRVLEF